MGDCGLQDIRFEGNIFTWWNQREILIPLGRSWTVLAAIQKGLKCFHKIGLEGQHLLVNKQRKRRFRFEAVWLSASDCVEVIKNAWTSTGDSLPHKLLLEKIRASRTQLSHRDRGSFGNIRRKLKELHESIFVLQQQNITAEVKAELEVLKDAVEDMFSKEENMWKQRAKVLWLAAGDRNTGLFHAKANARRLRKEIKNIIYENGEIVNDKEGIQGVVLRPISLCNMLYKVAFKAIANRIKHFLDILISTSQAAFVPGPLITDNVLIAYELNHFIKHKNRGKKGYVSLKSDVSKAYDRVEWRFLERFLLRIGFHSKFVSLIMTCVTSVTFSFLLNEAFSGLIRKAKVEGSIQGVVKVPRHEKYLGLPTVVGRLKRELFDSIKDRMWSKLQNWVVKKLFEVGRAILLKAVLQTIPTYIMSCFRLPDSFLSDLESIMADFFWHGRQESRIHWMDWAKLCKPKTEGGLGFRRLKEFNLALLAKQVWGISLCPGNMLHSVIRNKHFPGSTVFKARLGVSLPTPGDLFVPLATS
ncbi:UNVERIFIED_CONTAM: hypothetical protein Sradi_1885800 [Sesamum radiatum]|uniref:Reverse transcriptase domain-containing protein n=1 Tax=Sesamum radiatum TaxID=300843 RepID=A0AAW2TY83_SESRA